MVWGWGGGGMFVCVCAGGGVSRLTAFYGQVSESFNKCDMHCQNKLRQIHHKTISQSIERNIIMG